MSDNLWVPCEHGRTDQHMHIDRDEHGRQVGFQEEYCPGGRKATDAEVIARLRQIEGVEPDYEAALYRLVDLVGRPHQARVQDFLLPGLRGEERKEALVALRSADEEAERLNQAAIREIVDAALAGRLVVPVPEETT